MKSLISKAKKIHFDKRFTKCNLEKSNMWDVIKDIVPNKKKKSKTFNSFFAKVGEKVYNETKQSRDINAQQTSASDNGFHSDRSYFRPKPVKVETVIDTILSLKNKNAYGADGISSRFLRDSLPVLAFYITVIMNTSIVTGIFPEQWKYALVSPLFKQGDPGDPCNFRPISLLATLSKVIEKIVANQLNDFISANSLFSNTQHGFRRFLSTETALIKVTEKLYENID